MTEPTKPKKSSRFLRVIPQRLGVGHIFDSQTNMILCGRGFPFVIDYVGPISRGDCKQCLQSKMWEPDGDD